MLYLVHDILGVDLSDSWNEWIHAQTGRVARLWQLIINHKVHWHCPSNHVSIIMIVDRICSIFFLRSWTWEDFIRISVTSLILVIRLFFRKTGRYLTSYSVIHDCFILKIWKRTIWNRLRLVKTDMKNISRLKTHITNL